MNLKLWYKYSLLIFFCLLGFGQLERIQFNQQLAFYLHDVFLVGWIVLAMTFDRQIRTEVWRHVTQAVQFLWPVLIWAVLGWGNAVYEHASLFLPSLYALRLCAYLVLGTTLYEVVKQKYLSVSEFLEQFVITGTIILVAGLYQYFYLPDVKFLQFLGWDDHFYRLISTIFDPGFTGILFVLNFCLLQLYIQLQPNLKWLGKTVAVVLSLGFVLGLLLTYSRASFLAFAIALGVGVVSFFRQGKRQLAGMYCILLVLFSTAIPFLPRPAGEGVKLERSSTIVARTSAAEQSVEEVHHLDWILGKGVFLPVERTAAPAAYQVPDHGRLQDNWLVFFFTDMGVVGLGIVVGYFFWYLWWSYKQSTWLLGSSLAVMVHGLFNASLFYPLVLVYMSGVVTAVLVGQSFKKKKPN